MSFSCFKPFGIWGVTTYFEYTKKCEHLCPHLHMVSKCVYYLCEVIIFLSTILLMWHEMYTLVLISSSDHGKNVKARTKNKGTQARPTIQTR